MHDEVICPIIVSLDQTVPQDLLAKFYPNPSPKEVMIAFETLPSTYDLVLYDNMGRVVKTVHQIQDDRYLLSKGELPAGIYHAQLQFEDTNLAPVQASIVFQ